MRVLTDGRYVGAAATRSGATPAASNAATPAVAIATATASPGQAWGPSPNVNERRSRRLASNRSGWALAAGSRFAAVEQLKQEGYPVDQDDLVHVWPTRYAHINVHGKYRFNVEEARGRQGLRPLRQPRRLA